VLPRHPGRYLELERYEEALEMTNRSLRVRVTTLGKHKNTDATIRNALEQARQLAGSIKNKRKAGSPCPSPSPPPPLACFVLL